MKKWYHMPILFVAFLMTVSLNSNCSKTKTPVDNQIQIFSDSTPLRGDSNCDGSINNFDIDPFVAGVIGDPSGYTGTEECWNNRDKWGDINQDDSFNNFDIDPFVSCALGERIITDSGCGIKKNEVTVLTEPTTNRQFSIFIPKHFNTNSDLVIVSIPGTSTTNVQEMGPHQRNGTNWPDCGDQTWPELSNSGNYKPFAVICPSVYFNGNVGATICNMKMDEDLIIKSIQWLSNKKEFPNPTSGLYSVTGQSSGGSLALTIGMDNHTIFKNIVVRYSSFEDIATNNYTLNTVRNCLNTATECEPGVQGYTAISGWQNTCTGSYDWRTDAALRNQHIYIINNSIEDFENFTIANLPCHQNPCGPECSWGSLNCNSIVPFTNIEQIVYSTGGNYSPQSCDAVDNGYPYGGHYEARKLAADFIAAP